VTGQQHVFMVVNTYAPHDPRVIYSAASLTKLGYVVSLLGTARQTTKDLPTRQKIDGVNVFIVPVAYGYNPLRLLAALWQLLTGNPGAIQSGQKQMTSLASLLILTLWILRIGLFQRINVVHCHDLSPMFACWLLARLKRARLIYDIHENVPTMYSGRKGRWMSRLELFLVPRVDVVIAAGERLAKLMRTERGARQVVHIGNWKRLEEYDIAEECIHAMREKLHIPYDAIIITYIGTVDPTREILPLLEAAAQAPDVHFILGGRGLLEAEVIAAAGRHANMHWLGWVALRDIPLYSKLSDALYCCWTSEHWAAPAANKIFEAFAAGCPIIITRGVNEISDIVEASGAGILVDDVTPESLVIAFRQLRQDDLVNDLKQKSLRAREVYNWSVAEERLAAIYAGLLGES
jgi:glycosyltransferase involved in cell wall biosynthesis